MNLRRPAGTPFRLLLLVAGLPSIVLLFPALALGQATHSSAHGASPYAGWEAREIKALSPEQVHDLRSGAGMSLALAGELNGYPGPRHLLDLAEPLELTAPQRDRTQAVFAAMQQGAAALGAALVDRERDLDRAFAEGRLDDAALERLTAEIGRLQGALRHVHLQAHLEMKRVLSPAQVRRYEQLRGYTRGAPGQSGPAAPSHGAHGGIAR